MAKYGFVIVVAIVWISVVCTHMKASASSLSLMQRGEKCGNLTKDVSAICDPAVSLECSNGTCDCKSGFTISRNGTKCLEVARFGLESPCEESIQCWKSLMGRLAECHIGTHTCSCYESETLPIVYHQGRCYYGESLGEYCQIEGLCSATTANAICKSGTCQCQEGYVPSWDKSRCLPIATNGLNSSCEENIQCEKSLLGTLSECNQDRMQCACYSMPEMVPTVFYHGRCYFGAGLGDVCQVNPQCTSKTLYSICGKDGKCRCDDGYIPNSNYTACFPMPTSYVASDGATEQHGQSEPFPECLDSSQCSANFGYFSRCNTTKRKCECFNPDTNATMKEPKFITTNTTVTPPQSSSSSTSQQEGIKCYTTKHLGQRCKFHRQCSTLTENAVCVKGLCECNDKSHVASEDHHKCLQIAKGLESDCDEDVQCTKSPLGVLSTCNPVSHKCHCSHEFPVVYHEPRCYFLRQLGATCQSDFECRSNTNSLAECRDGKCKCGSNSFSFQDEYCIIQVNRPPITSTSISRASYSKNNHDNHFSVVIVFVLSAPFYFFVGSPNFLNFT